MTKPLTAPGTALASKQLVSANTGIEALVPRDQWDRPLILPPEGHNATCKPRTGKGGGCTCMEGYTRVSTMAEALSDPFGLNRYKQMNVVKGMAVRPALVTAAQVAKNKQELYAIVDEAQDVGDDVQAARNGSTFHRVVEMWLNGQDTSHLPENLQAMLHAYTTELAEHGFTLTEAEQFVVQDTVKTAGTFDNKVIGPDGIYVSDTKTGQTLKYLALKTTMQVALYAASAYYDIGTHERSPLGVDRDRGILMWCPWVEDPDDARCEARWLDLKLGRKAVLEAQRLREFRSLNAEQLLLRVH